MVAVTNDLGRNRPRFAFGSIRSFFGGKSNTAKSNRNDPEVVCFRNHSSGSFVQVRKDFCNDFLDCYLVDCYLSPEALALLVAIYHIFDI